MIKMTWKSTSEIELALAGTRRLAVFTCDFCANLSGAGGARGLRRMSGLLEGWGKEVILGRSVVPCCSETVMSQALRIHRKRLSRCDVLIILSCPTGVKAAALSEPGLFLFCPLEATGGIMITGRADSPLTRSVCSACGNCVITYTGGICPLEACPLGRKYGPCGNYPEEGTSCSTDPDLPCVWKIIEAVGNMDALRQAERLHQLGDAGRLPGPASGETPAILRKLSSWLAARISSTGALRVAGLLK